MQSIFTCTTNRRRCCDSAFECLQFACDPMQSNSSQIQFNFSTRNSDIISNFNISSECSHTHRTQAHTYTHAHAYEMIFIEMQCCQLSNDKLARAQHHSGGDAKKASRTTKMKQCEMAFVLFFGVSS